jgi:citrate lyase subunit beta/citryl-CoA lyase
MAGRANGLHVIDGPFLNVRDLDGTASSSVDQCGCYGFDGKWALTPDQAIVLNEVYSPSQEQFDKSYRHSRRVSRRDRGRT